MSISNKEKLVVQECLNEAEEAFYEVLKYGLSGAAMTKNGKENYLTIMRAGFNVAMNRIKSEK